MLASIAIWAAALLHTLHHPGAPSGGEFEGTLIWRDLPAARDAEAKFGEEAGRGGSADGAEPQIATGSASPEQLRKTVTYYHSRGEAEKAEKTLRDAYDCCKEKLGENHVATKWTGRQLAGVYQLALNSSEPSGTATGGTVGHQKMPVGPVVSARTRAQVTARQVREQLFERPAGKVAPVLTEALQNSNDLNERLALIKALGELGPGARPAVATLCERLQKSDDAGERLAVLTVLEQMGSAARDAAPALTALTATNVANVRVADAKKDAAPAGARQVTETEVLLAQQVLNRLNERASRVGVVDPVGLFPVKTIREITSTLQALLRDSDVEVRIETTERPLLSPLPSRMGPLAVQVVLTPAGKVARVYVSPQLRDRGIDAAGLQKQLAECCGKGEHEQAVSLVVSAVKQAKAEKKK